MSTFDVKESGQRGTLSLGNDGLTWKDQSGDRNFSLKKKDAESAVWFRTSHKHFQFRVKRVDDGQLRFDGFDAKDQKALQNFCTAVGWTWTTEKLDVQESERNVDVVTNHMLTIARQGKNAGKFEVVGEDLVFKVFTTNSKGEISSERRSFDISLNSVKNAQANTSKDELLLEFSQGENNSGRKNECIMTEMRFYVPNVNQDNDDDDVKRSVEVMQSEISKFVIKEATGTQIAKLEEIKCKYPRNTFEISLYDSVFKMHGQSYDFSIKYKNISRLIMVPNPSVRVLQIGFAVFITLTHILWQNQVYLVICLIEPERKGGTQYNAIVAVFDPDEEADVAVTLPADFNTKYRDFKNKEAIKSKMSGPYHEIVCTLLQFFSSTANKQMKVHRLGKFKATAQKDHAGAPIGCVKCSVAANTGYLYLLDNCFVFLEKPPLVFMYENVDSITWDIQSGMATVSSLSFKIKLDNKKAQEFSTIPKAEVKNMNAFFEAISTQKHEGKKMVIANFVGGDDDDDKSDDKSDEDRHIKNRLQADADDDESSEDADFHGSGAEDSDDDSGSEDDDSDEGGDEEKPRKEKSKPAKKESSKSKPKPKSKSKGSDDEDGSDDEGAASPKKGKPKKAKKDPNAPKKAKSAWLLFCDAMRETVKNENEGIAFTEINAVISKKWNALTEEEKRPYEERAKKLAAEYKQSKAQYDAEHPELAAAASKKRKGGDDGKEGKGDKGDGKAKKAKKDPNAPKRGQNAFMLYSNAMRDKVRKDNPSMSIKDVAKEIGGMWKAMGPEEKKEWEDKSKQDRERFQRENDAYQKGGSKSKGPTVEEFSKMAEGSDDSDDDSDDDDDGGKSKKPVAKPAAKPAPKAASRSDDDDDSDDGSD